MAESYKNRFAAKWPEEVAQRGFAPIPKCLITCMSDLGIKPQEAAVLFNIIERCWKAGDKAWPGVDYLAKNIGRKETATKEITGSLAKKGLIGKQQRFNKTNLYDLEPLAKKLAAHMPECRYAVGNPNNDSRKPGPLDSRNSVHYIEPLTRKHDIEPLINSQHFINEDTDQPHLEGNEDLAKTHKHMWREFELEKFKGEEPFTRYYFACKQCGLQYHNDGKKPWKAEYPLLTDD